MGIGCILLLIVIFIEDQGIDKIAWQPNLLDPASRTNIYYHTAIRASNLYLKQVKGS